MSRAINLPGGTATIREPHDVPERLRRPVAKLVLALSATTVRDAADRDLTDEEARRLIGIDFLGLYDDMVDALILALVERWSYPQPVTLDGVLELPSAVYAALKAELIGHVRDVVPDIIPAADADQAASEQAEEPTA